MRQAAEDLRGKVVVEATELKGAMSGDKSRLASTPPAEGLAAQQPSAPKVSTQVESTYTSMFGEHTPAQQE